MLSRAPHGAEATAPGRHRCLLMTVLGMLFSHRSHGAREAASGGEAAPPSSGDMRDTQAPAALSRVPREGSAVSPPLSLLPLRLAHGSMPPTLRSHSGSSAPDLGKLRHGGQRGVTAGHGPAVLIC